MRAFEAQSRADAHGARLVDPPGRPCPPYLCLMLPFPPSVNHLFAGKARRFVSKRYRAWRIEAGHALALQRPMQTCTGQVAVTYTFGRPNKRKRDLGNLEKAVSDILVAHGILADDSLIEKITLQWGDVVGCRVEIESIV